MELKIEEIKAALVRLQGQVDVWTFLYKEAEKNEAAKHVDVSQA